MRHDFDLYLDSFGRKSTFRVNGPDKDLEYEKEYREIKVKIKGRYSKILSSFLVIRKHHYSNKGILVPKSIVPQTTTDKGPVPVSDVVVNIAKAIGNYPIGKGKE